MARAIVADAGADWLRADALQMVEGIYTALTRNAHLHHIAERLRATAALLDEDPTSYLRSQLVRIEADARRALAHRATVPPTEPDPAPGGCPGPDDRPDPAQQEQHP